MDKICLKCSEILLKYMLAHKHSVVLSDAEVTDCVLTLQGHQLFSLLWPKMRKFKGGEVSVKEFNSFGCLVVKVTAWGMFFLKEKRIYCLYRWATTQTLVLLPDARGGEVSIRSAPSTVNPPRRGEEGGKIKKRKEGREDRRRQMGKETSAERQAGRGSWKEKEKEMEG